MTTNDEQYVPSEGAVKLAWAERRLFLDSMGEGGPSPDAVYNAKIDRFLARVRRDAAANALYEVATDIDNYADYLMVHNRARRIEENR